MRRKRERAIFSLARSQTETYNLTKVNSSSQVPSSSSPTLITGLALAQSVELPSTIYRRNVVLQYSGEIPLQRFSPSSRHQDTNMSQEAKQGAIFLDHLYEGWALEQIISDDQAPSQEGLFRRFKFGGCYVEEVPGKYKLDMTPDSQVGDPGWLDGKPIRTAIRSFSGWFRDFAERFIQQIITHADSTLCDKYRTKLTGRSKIAFPWACDRIGWLEKTCLPFYTNFATSKGFDAAPQVDKEDADPSIMVNFGQHALIELIDYNHQVELQPLDVVFFSANQLKYRMIQHHHNVEAGLSPDDRWFVHCSFLRDMEMQKEPKVHDVRTHAIQAGKGREAERRRRIEHLRKERFKGQVRLHAQQLAETRQRTNGQRQDAVKSEVVRGEEEVEFQLEQQEEGQQEEEQQSPLTSADETDQNDQFGVESDDEIGSDGGINRASSEGSSVVFVRKVKSEENHRARRNRRTSGRHGSQVVPNQIKADEIDDSTGDRKPESSRTSVRRSRSSLVSNGSTSSKRARTKRES